VAVECEMGAETGVEDGVVFEDDNSGFDGVERVALFSRIRQPAWRARRQPDLQASTASSGMSQARREQSERVA